MTTAVTQERESGGGGRRATAARLIGAVGSGLILAAAFPPVGLWWCAPIAVALLTGVTITARRVRGAFGLGFVAGFSFFLVLLEWLKVVGSDAWIMLALFCALWIGLVGLLSFILAANKLWPLWIGAVWVAQEALRDRIPWGGFPWGRLAFSQADSPTLGWASLGGAPLITFVVAAIGAGLCWLVFEVTNLRPRMRRTAVSGGTNSLIAVAVALGMVAALAAGGVIPRPIDGQEVSGPAYVQVALIQGGVPGEGLDAMSERQAVLNNHVNQTIALAEQVKAGTQPQPELVIWPENSSDIDPLSDRQAFDAINNAAEAIGVPILVGAVMFSRTNPGTLWNVGIVWDPVTGPGELYVKRHPVPFGEYIPGRSLLQRFISRFDRVPYDFSPGSNPGVLQVGPAKLADVICFEVAYDDVVRDAVLAGGRAITVQTNNATYTSAGPRGDAQSAQQAAMSQIRAVEHGRSVLIAATSGITAIIDPAGQVVAQAPILESTSLSARIPLRDSITVADRLGSWPELLVFLLVAVGVGLTVNRHHRRSAAESQTAQPVADVGPDGR